MTKESLNEGPRCFARTPGFFFDSHGTYLLYALRSYALGPESGLPRVRQSKFSPSRTQDSRSAQLHRFQLGALAAHTPQWIRQYQASQLTKDQLTALTTRSVVSAGGVFIGYSVGRKRRI